jgi:hypothetical protein
LHRIVSPVWKPDALSSTVSQNNQVVLLQPPQDQIELAERILTWWQVYLWDRLGSIITGFIGALPSEDNAVETIETVFPRNFSDYEEVSNQLIQLST